MPDTKGRRKRLDPRQPKGKDQDVTPRRLAVLQHIQTHGMLPSTYTSAFDSIEGWSRTTLKTNLTERIDLLVALRLHTASRLP